MHQRTFADTGRTISEIGLGCWQLGADWGTVGDQEALSILESAVDNGITFIDTADVYGDGRSERLIGQFLRGREEPLFVATKVGRKNFPGPYTETTLRQHINESRERLGVEALDLVQLHCIPAEVMSSGEIFGWLRDLKREGLIRHFGASIESMEEANSIVNVEGLTSLQIIFNIFRQKPIDSLFESAQSNGVGIIVRLPLASGLLAGKMSVSSKFASDDHRNYNRDGAAFNVGETFAGLPFEIGLDLVERIRPLVPEGMTMAQFAQRWILDHDAVSTVITGASRAAQVIDNARTSSLPPLSPETHEALRSIYTAEVREHIRGVY